MREMTKVLVACVVAVCVAVPATAMTVDEVIAKHIEAKGGKAAWEAIDAIKLTGDFTAFSEVAPFTLVQTRGNHYFLDHEQNGRKVVVGYDGKQAWWDNEWMGAGAKTIAGPDLAVVMREIDFGTPFLVYEERGWAVELVGETEIEGFPAVAVKLTRDDEQSETWYFDPDTYLELARTSPGSDFGRAMEQRRFYDDFREVSGLMIPHYTETQWYTRDRVMRVKAVEVNPTVDVAMFKMPAPPGMGPLMDMVGEWTVALQTRPQPGAPWQDSESKSTIEKMLKGAMLQESTANAGGNQTLRMYSFDQYKEHYRLTSINDQTTHMDIAEGTFDEDGRLVVSNVETDTPWSGFGMTFHQRTSFFDITENGFKMEMEISVDGGENWFLAGKATYTRTTDQAAN